MPGVLLVGVRRLLVTLSSAEWSWMLISTSLPHQQRRHQTHLATPAQHGAQGHQAWHSCMVIELMPNALGMTAQAAW